MLACWQTYEYFNIVSNIVNKKTGKKALFLATEKADYYGLQVAEDRNCFCQQVRGWVVVR